MNRLSKSSSNKIISGVCGGIAEYLNIDPTIVRVLYFIVFYSNMFTGLVVYLVLATILPTDNSTYYEDYAYDGSQENRTNSNLILGLALLVLGAALLTKHLIPEIFYQVRRFWPVSLILIGLYLIYNSKEEK